MKNRNRIMKLLLAVCLLTAVFSFDCANAWTGLIELKCGDMVWCNWFDDGRMDIYVSDYHSTAPMWDFSTDFRPDYFDPKLLSDYKLIQLRFCEGISHVGNYAFCGAKDLETVTFANDSVTSIGNSAFEDCRNLVSITLPAKLNSIGMRAFSDCSRLGMLILPESLTTIGDYAFNKCSDLQTLTIPDSVTSIGANAFTSCGGNWKSFTLQCSCRNTYVPTYAEENGIPVLINHHFVDGVCADCGAGESIIDSGECGLCDSDGNFGKDVVWSLYNSGRMVIHGSDDHPCEMADLTTAPFVPWNSYREFITSVEITGKVTNVGRGAFNGSSKLKSVSICDSVTSIDYGAFAECYNLTDVSLSNNLTYLGDLAFYNCSALPSITLSDTLKIIDYFVFSDCYSLQTVTIPDGVESINDEAFYACSSLTEISIPDSVETFGFNVFSNHHADLTITCGCASAARAYVDEKGIKTSLIHHYADNFCTGCGEPENCVARGECGAEGGSVEWLLIDNGKLYIRGTGAIADHASEEAVPWRELRGSVASVEVKSGVTGIGDYAFYGCVNLTDVSIPDSIADIGDYAFADCSNLTEISIPDSVSDIASNAFDNHNASLTITCGCNSEARKYADEYDITTSLKHNIVDEVCIDCDLNVIASGECGPFKDNRPTPETVWKLYDNGKLIIRGHSDTPGRIEDFTDPNTVLWKNYRDSITSIEIKDSVSNIGMFAFYMCFNLERVVIPNGVTDIGEAAFYECTKLVDVTLPNSLKNIGDSAFSNCSNLQTLTIPDSVTTIGAYAFGHCFQLQTVTIPDSVKTIGMNAFYECGSLTITCGCNSAARAYADENGINTSITHKYVDDFCIGCGKQEYLKKGNCGDNVTYKLHNDGTLTVSGTGRMADYTSTDNPHPWYDYRSSVRTVVIESGVTYIGNSAFYGLFNLTSVSIANSVTEIGEYAFSTSRMPDIEIPNSVTKVGKYAFQDCGSLTEVTVPGSILTIPYDMFYRCRNLKKVTIGNGVQEIGMSAFNSCESLTEVSIPNSVTTVGFAAFMDCEELAELAIPEGVKSIGERAFFSCASLTNVSIPDSVTEIGKDAFGIRNENLMITCGCTSDAKTYADNNGILTSLLHVEVIDPYLPATRTAFGLTEGSHCGRCEEVVTPQEEIAPLTDIPVVELPRDTKAIEDEAFAGSAIECAVLPNGCESICSKAFANCALLKIVEIPESVTDIDPDAFVNTQNVVIVTTEGSAAEVFAKQHGLYCRVE